MRRNPIVCAVDASEKGRVLSLANAVKPYVGMLKIGMEAFYANGPDIVRRVSECGLPVFLDLKLHDISHTVCSAFKALLPLEPAMLTVHAGCGEKALRRLVETAQEEADKRGARPPKLFGVTVLTGLAEEDLSGIGFLRSTEAQVLYMADYCREAGLDGVVCSPHEIAALKREAPGLALVVPGLRPPSAEIAEDDQRRTLPPKEALALGADYLVIGRPITKADDPAAAAREIWESVSGE
jgi:orotidine-5'-phosphate decarboxylase